MTCQSLTDNDFLTLW